MQFLTDQNFSGLGTRLKLKRKIYSRAPQVVCKLFLANHSRYHGSNADANPNANRRAVLLIELLNRGLHVAGQLHHGLSMLLPFREKSAGDQIRASNGLDLFQTMFFDQFVKASKNLVEK